MNNAQAWTGLRVLIAATTFGIWVASDASASPMSVNITYKTIGSVGYQTGDIGSPVIFHGVNNGSFDSSAPFNLGEFEVVPWPQNSGPREVNMPFMIAYKTTAIDGVEPTTNETPVIIQGWIQGTLDDGDQSNLRAIFNQGVRPTDPNFYSPHPVPPFQTADLINTINVNNSIEFLTLATTSGARTRVEARIDVVPVPEPTTLALFAVLGFGLCCRFRFSH